MFIKLEFIVYWYLINYKIRVVKKKWTLSPKICTAEKKMNINQQKYSYKSDYREFSNSSGIDE